MACPLVLVPGLLGTVESHYATCLPWWSDRTTTGIELPGHGGDTMPADLMTAAVERLRAAVLATDEAPLLVGVSYLGAAVAVLGAETLHEQVRGVVVSGYSFTARPDVLRRWLHGFTRLANGQPRTQGHFAALHGDNWADLLTTVLGDLDLGRLRFPGLADVTELRLPLMLINGALLENERTAVEPAVRAGADVAVVAGAGHLVTRDSPRVFAALVDDFATRITGRHTVFHERQRIGEEVGSRVAVR